MNILTQVIVTVSNPIIHEGVLASDGWYEAWWPSHKVHPGAFSGQTGMEDP